VSFYAVDPGEADSLRQKLINWAPSLPAEVREHYAPFASDSTLMPTDGGDIAPANGAGLAPAQPGLKSADH